MPPPPNQQATNVAFFIVVSPIHKDKAPEIRRAEGMNRSKLLEIAHKVYNSQDSATGRQNNSPVWWLLPLGKQTKEEMGK